MKLTSRSATFGRLYWYQFMSQLRYHNYFHQDLEQKRTKQKSCGKSFKIVLVLAYGRMPRKLQLTILGRIAYFINGFKNSKRFFTVVTL